MFRAHSLLQKVALVTIVPVLVLGFAIQRAIERQVRARALDEAVRTAELVATVGVQPQVASFDLQAGLSGDQVAQLDRALAAPSRDGQLVRMKIWNQARRIVYSDDHTLIGAETGGGEQNEGLVDALAGGTDSELLRPGATDHGDENVDAGTAELLQAHGELLEVYAPLVFPSDERPSGVFEMYIPYAAVDARVNADVRRIQLLLFGGLAVLYVVLLPIVAGASRRLRRQAQIEREAADGLRQADEMKNSFLTAVSHELRTPLSSILGCAVSLGQREELGLSEEDVDDLTGRLEANARKLNRLLSDLLDLDRLSQGILEPRRDATDIGELIRTIIEDTRAAEQRTLHVDVPPLVLELDAAKVERIVENLIVNNLRHSAGGDLWIRVEPDVNGMLLVVEDDGDGVPSELRDEIFEPFTRGRSPSHAPGVGVGLSIVSNFAKLHGGRAWVEDRAGGGASFHVLIPGRRVTALVPTA
jgi:signal transduction histidine kinase